MAPVEGYRDVFASEDVAEMVGQVRGWTLEQTDAITTANAERFFGWRVSGS